MDASISVERSTWLELEHQTIGIDAMPREVLVEGRRADFAVFLDGGSPLCVWMLDDEIYQWPQHAISSVLANEIERFRSHEKRGKLERLGVVRRRIEGVAGYCETSADIDLRRLVAAEGTTASEVWG
jgi:hypothetical protein